MWRLIGYCCLCHCIADNGWWAVSNRTDTNSDGPYYTMMAHLRPKTCPSWNKMCIFKQQHKPRVCVCLSVWIQVSVWLDLSLLSVMLEPWSKVSSPAPIKSVWYIGFIIQPLRLPLGYTVVCTREHNKKSFFFANLNRRITRKNLSRRSGAKLKLTLNG